MESSKDSFFSLGYKLRIWIGEKKTESFHAPGKKGMEINTIHSSIRARIRDLLLCLRGFTFLVSAIPS